jgi:hemerythrin superfamily protein
MMATKAQESPAKTATPTKSRRKAAPTRRGQGGSTGVAAMVGVAAVGLAAGFALNLGRKAMVQAPSVTAGDWLAAIKLEHKAALALFDAILGTDDTQVAKRTLLLAQLKHALGKHAFMEENAVYPALRAWGDKADADKLNHDHGYVKQALYELENLDKDAPFFIEKATSFRAELDAHIREEENAIFPPLHAGLGDEGNAKLTAAANKEGFKMA